MASTPTVVVSNWRKTSLEEIEVASEEKCCLCKRSTVDALNLGSLYQKDGVKCHYYCLLFCSNLKQNGGDDEGILGFIPEDIRREVGRVHASKRMLNFYVCCYCGETGATIGCCLAKCKKLFHFPCGLENRVNYRFCSNFASYCKEHTDLKYSRPIRSNRVCAICTNGIQRGEVEATGGQQIIFGSCCDYSHFHKDCIQQYALSAGYFFKCPTCSDKDTFMLDVRMQGVYVPNREASWEAPDNYRNFRRLYATCDAEECLCPSGRKHAEKNFGSWRLLRCGDCAASATHIGCCPGATTEKRWQCTTCLEVEENLSERKSGSSMTTGSRSNAGRTTLNGERQSGPSSSSSSKASSTSRSRSSSVDSISSTASSMFVVVTKPQVRRRETAPDSVVTPPEVVMTVPEAVVTPPEVVVTAPESVVTPPKVVLTAPEAVVIPPEAIVTPITESPPPSTPPRARSRSRSVSSSSSSGCSTASSMFEMIGVRYVKKTQVAEKTTSKDVPPPPPTLDKAKPPLFQLSSIAQYYKSKGEKKKAPSTSAATSNDGDNRPGPSGAQPEATALPPQGSPSQPPAKKMKQQGKSSSGLDLMNVNYSNIVDMTRSSESSDDSSLPDVPEEEQEPSRKNGQTGRRRSSRLLKLRESKIICIDDSD